MVPSDSSLARICRFAVKLSALLASFQAACLNGHQPLTPPAPVASHPILVIYLIGDAGAPDPDGEPVLRGLEEDIRERPEGLDRHIVFLGDNIYPKGLPPEGAPDRSAMERRLLDQVRVAVRTSTPAVFVPGNHDWSFSGEDGWNAVLRQESLVEEIGGGLVEFLPDGGCPGPAVRDLGAGVRLVVLDTEWWLRTGPKPVHPDSSCPADSRSEVLEHLGNALAGADHRHVIVVGHHPLLTGGPHGGHFTWDQHIFPLREWKSWLWVPLPILGSVYPIARMNGISDQDASSGPYRAMRSAIESVLSEHRPLAFASGHTHGLEVMEGGQAALFLMVSGAGYYGHTSSLARLEETLYASDGESGFMRIEIERDGRARLSVVTVDEDGRSVEAFAIEADRRR